MKNRKELGAFLKGRREELDLTQADISEALNMSSPQFVSNIERGRALIPIKQIPVYAKCLSIRPLQLFRIQMAVKALELERKFLRACK